MNKGAPMPPQLALLTSLLWRSVVAHRRLFGAIVVLSTAVALSLAVALPGVWQARGILAVGQVASPDNLLEPAEWTVERIMSEGLQTMVLERNRIPEDDPQTELYHDSLFAEFMSGTQMISVKLRAFSPKEARLLLETTLAVIKEQHQSATDQSIAVIEAELARLDDQIERTRSLELQLFDLSVGGGSSDGDLAFLRSFVVGDRLSVLNARIIDLQARHYQIKEQLNPIRTFYTTTLQGVSVDKYPVAPRRVLITIAGLILGLVIGLGVVVLLELRPATPRE